MSAAKGGPDDGGFLDRWSRRKREVAAEAAETAEPPVEAVAPAPEDVAEPEPEVDDAFLASLPKLEEITAATDVRPFLRRGVPETLKNAALRRLWTLHPGISTYEDPARDYFWDYNAPGGVPGGGGALVPEKVAEMARKLLSGRTPPTAEPDPAVVERSETETAESPQTSEGAPSPPIEEVAGPEPGGVGRTSEADLPSETTPERPALSAPRRRHGGAMPG